MPFGINRIQGVKHSEMVCKSPVTAAIAGGLLGYVASIFFGWAFSYYPISIGGLDPIFSVIGAILVSGVVAIIMAWMFGIRKKVLKVRHLSAAILITAACSTFTFHRMQAREHINLSFLKPIPDDLVIHEEFKSLFELYIHFSTSPQAIAAMIKAKDLIPFEKDQEKQSYSYSIEKGFHPAWWAPFSMSKPKLYVHMHTESPQPWLQYIWVNDKTNEVYGFVGG